VPISAFIFGGRRSDTMPLVYQSFNWAYGVYAAATMGSETTAAAAGAKSAKCAATPSPCSPSPAITWAITSTTGCNSAATSTTPAHLQCVNWFRKDENGKFIWPGFGDNMRILKWVVERANGQAASIESPLGWMPRYEDLYDRLPKEMTFIRELLLSGLWRSPEHWDLGVK
jgi:phosphoenolpyruvate carboxykinase (GTP)